MKLRHPSVFTSRVNKSLRDANGPVPVNVVLNPAAYIECTHVAILPHHHANSISFCQGGIASSVIVAMEIYKGMRHADSGRLFDD